MKNQLIPTIFISVISVIAGCLDLRDQLDPIISEPEEVHADTLDSLIGMLTENVNENESRVLQTPKSNEWQLAGNRNISDALEGMVRKIYIEASWKVSKISNQTDQTFVEKLSDQIHSIAGNRISNGSQSSYEAQMSDTLKSDGPNIRLGVCFSFDDALAGL